VTDLDIRRVPYDHPDPQALTAEVQAFYVRLYGGPDGSPFDAEEFAPPNGAFLVGYLDDTPVAMGGWRFSHEGVPPEALRPAELKRMYVRDTFRGRGLARRLLAALERDAADAGADWLILQTAVPQIAAVKLYRSSGYTAIPSFGYYAGARGVVNLGKPLGDASST
jgi:GNAT superfamily N-acetyltransferase